MRKSWWLVVCLAASAVLAQAAAEVVMAWIESGARSAAQRDGGAQAVAATFEFDCEAARVEYQIAVTAADHRRVTEVWLANARYLAAVENPQARGQYQQELAQAAQRHLQAMSTGWQVWTQATNSAWQRQMQSSNTSWQEYSGDLNQQSQRLMAGLQTAQEPPDLSLEDLLSATTADTSAARAALLGARDTAGTALSEALATADRAWREGVAEAAVPDGDLDEIDKALDREARAWTRAVNDALDTYRDAARRAIREFELACEEA